MCTAACGDDRPCVKGLSCSDGVCTPDGAELREGSLREPDGSNDVDASSVGDGPDATMSSEDVMPSDDAASSTSPVVAPDDTSSPVPLEEFGQAFLRATCELMFGCREREYDERRFVLGNVEKCIQILGWLPTQRDVEARVGATRAGLFRYDPELARLALSRIERGCKVISDPFEGDSTFDEVGPEVFDGNVQLGGACNADTECQGDAYCEGPTGNCVGSCQPRTLLGQPCSADVPCSHTNDAWPLACDSFRREASVCGPTVVVSNLAEGADCKPFMHLGSDSEIRVCGSKLTCSGERSDAGICTPLLGLGGECNNFRLCEEGALCTLVDDETRSICQVPELLQTEGADCSEFSNVCDILQGFRCDDETRVCVYEGDGTLGAGCDDILCASELYCGGPGADPVCSPRLPTGAECTFDRACESDRCFNEGGIETCIPRFCSAL